MWLTFKIMNFLLVLLTANIWLAFIIAPRIYLFGIDAIMIACCLLGKFNMKFSNRVPILMLVLALITGLAAITRDSVASTVSLLCYFPVILVYMLDKEHQQDLLDSVTKWFAVMMVISIFVYALAMANAIPSFGKFWPETLRATYSSYDNYIFFLKGNYSLLGGRFNGPFLEPGHMALVSVLLLFANRLQMKSKPWLWVLVVCVLLSLSLAGYILLMLAVVFIKLRSVATAVGIGIVVGIGYITVTQLWDEGRNPVNVMVLGRLEYDKSKGIKGNNRTVLETDKYFTKCCKDGTIWLGVKNTSNKGRKILGAGYKIYLLRNGAVMLMLVGAYYMLLAAPGTNRRYKWSFLLFIALSFMQRGYPEWYSWMFSFTVGCGLTQGVKVYTLSKRKQRRLEANEAEAS